MKFIIVIVFEVFFAVSCGKPEAKEASDNARAALQSKVTLSPAPGTYQNGVIVLLQLTDESYWLEFKEPDGSWSSNADLCLGGLEASGYKCRTINQTTSIGYRIKKSILDDTSEEFSVEYKIVPQQKNVAINDSLFEERETYCRVRKENGKNQLNFRVKLSNESVLPGMYGYLLGQVADVARINEPLTVLSFDAGVAIVGSGDDAPQFADYYPGASASSDNTDSCTITLKEFIPGQKASGTISCVTSVNVHDDNKKFGDTATFSNVEWSCDAWE